MPPRDLGVTAAARPGRSSLIAAGLLLALVVAELVAGPALTPARRAHGDTDVLAVAGVAAMVHAAQVDQAEVAQVAATEHPRSPLAPSALALIDALFLVTLALPSRRLSLVGHLAVVIGGVAVAVAAIARLRYLVALYLSPPFGTLSYLELYGSFRRHDALVVVTALAAVRAVVYAAHPRGTAGGPAADALFAVAIASLAASVATVVCYSWAPVTLVSITDAVAAAAVALTAVVSAGIGTGRALRGAL